MKKFVVMKRVDQSWKRQLVHKTRQAEQAQRNLVIACQQVLALSEDIMNIALALDGHPAEIDVDGEEVPDEESPT